MLSRIKPAAASSAVTRRRRRRPDETMSDDAKRPSCRRSWTFAVRASGLRECETMCVVGDSPELGSWSSGAVVPLRPDPGSDLWTTTLDVVAGRDLFYRYCVCVLIDSVRTSIRTWETNLKPRKIPKDAEPSKEPDMYGSYGGAEKIERGWLTYETVLQLRFHKNPFHFKSSSSTTVIGVKLNPVAFQFSCGENAEDSLGSEADDGEAPKCIMTEVATVNLSNCKFAPQERYGRVYSEGDILIFNVVVSDFNAVAYTVEFYEFDAVDLSKRSPPLIGTSFILPSILKKTDGQIELPITCTRNRKTLGSMTCEYLIVRPMDEHLCDMKVSYATYWSSSWTGLDVGHRGSGSSFKTKESTMIRENTIASLKKATANGADMLEFDVQLSKDLVPVIYHDFHVCIALKKKNQIEHNEMLEIPMQDLTLDQLKKLKVYHVVEGRTNEQRFFDEDLAEHQPFPQLVDVLKILDPHVGFNIEIKGTLQLEDGSLELAHPIDLNIYLDKIIDVVLRHAGSRHILFSSFHPDICTMLRLKQNLYPTMFLTQGVTSRWPSYRDMRCNTIPAAMNHALNASLLGICVHTEDILRDPSQVKLVIDSGLKIFCWGEDNNNVETIKYLKQLGLHGVIYDKLDQYSTKEIKESIFLMEAREAKKETSTPQNEKNNAACKH